MPGSKSALGVFDTVFTRPTYGETLATIRDAGFSWIQLHFRPLGLREMPLEIPDNVIETVRQEAGDHNVRLAAISGTWNIIHPDSAQQDAGMAGLREIARVSKRLGTDVIAVSTGTRDPENMWRHHPDNDTPGAWAEMTSQLSLALEIADEFEVILAFEPEPANIAKNARCARQLLDEMAHPRLKICFDAANIVASDLTRKPADVIDEAIGLLGEKIVVAHGKDITADGAFCPAGTGIVPWPHCVSRLHGAGYSGPIVLHSLGETDLPAARSAILG